jgi:hypothetical protein
MIRCAALHSSSADCSTDHNLRATYRCRSQHCRRPLSTNGGILIRGRAADAHATSEEQQEKRRSGDPGQLRENHRCRVKTPSPSSTSQIRCRSLFGIAWSGKTAAHRATQGTIAIRAGPRRRQAWRSLRRQYCNEWYRARRYSSCRSQSQR